MTDDRELTTAELMRRARGEKLDLPNPDQEADRVLSTERGNRLAARRVAYRDEIAARAQEKPESEHKADRAMPFHRFEVVRSVELGPISLGGQNTEVFLSAKGSERDLAELRQRPDYVEDHWTLLGVHEPEEGQPSQAKVNYRVGDFRTEDQARDVLGGITGDRKFDQHPLQDWQSVAAWSDFAHSQDVPKLRERMTGDLTNRETARVQDARESARDDLAARLYYQKGALPEPGKMTETDGQVWQEVHEQTQKRPNEQLLGQGQRW